MQILRNTGLLLLILAFGLSSAALADDPIKGKVLRGKGLTPTYTAKTFAEVGNCRASQAESQLDVNNVRAAIYGNGPLFWRGGGHVYEVPKGGGVMSNFAGNVWIGGKVNGEIRITAADYHDYEFWSGPLDENGNPPADCSVYDRIWKVSTDDIKLFEDTGIASTDLQEWPFELGAEVIDGDGIEGNYNLAGGDRPRILGDQTLYWIMNDMGNVHAWAGTDPIGLEVQAYAFAFRSSGPLNETTFYRYVVTYKGEAPLEETYFGIWDDPDLGQFNNDYVGSDTTLGMGFVYNGEDDDADYGIPPAMGYDFFQGPIVDGEVLGMTRFMYYNNNSTVQGNPRVPSTDAYSYMSGFWQDGTPMTLGGAGYGGDTPVNFMFPGDPSTQAFWSETNVDGAGTTNAPDDRRFLMSSGPFTLNPGDTQEIVYGIVWALGTDRFDSVVRMKEADLLAQKAFDIGFQLPPPPDAPDFQASTYDSRAILTWSYRANSNNFAASYSVTDPLLSDDVPDNTYDFEGFILRQYPNDRFQDGRILAVYDVPNGVTRVIDGGDLTFVAAEGTDSGLEYSYVVDNLTNYQDYYFTIQAYAYNEFSSPKVYASAENRLTVRPSKIDGRNGGSRVQSEYLADIVAESVGPASDGSAAARVVDPAQVTGHEYRVQFYEYTNPDTVTVVTYDIVDTTTGEIKVDGRRFADRTGLALPQAQNVAVVDGISIDVLGPPPGYKLFETVANAAGPIVPSTGAAADWQGFPVPERPGATQQSTNDSNWLIATGGSGRASFDNGTCTGSTFCGRTTRDGTLWPGIIPYDWEWRFTGTTTCNRAFEDGVNVTVPFELWRIGVNTPDDPSDDTRVTCWLLEDGGGAEFDVFDITGDHDTSGADNDPASDWVYFRVPADDSPGEAGYLADEAAMLDGSYDYGGTYSMNRLVLVNWNGGAEPPYNADLPEEGTVFRVTTNKPNGPGTTFAINTAGLEFQTGQSDIAKDALDLIGITPNPYKGASVYEKSNFNRVARFVNLPERATIRVFSLDGTLIRTIPKNSAGADLDWDLQTDAGLPIASGMYLIHIEVKDSAGNVTAEKVLKFGVVMPRVQLEVF